MEIELYSADQLAPTSELFAALQNGTIDAVQSDDDSIAAPTDVSVFVGYFPLALRYSLDVPVLFNQLRAGRNLGCSLFGSGRQVALSRRLGSLPFHDQGSDLELGRPRR